MSISDQFEDHIHDILFDIGGIYAYQTLIGLTMHAENLFTLVHAARDAISMENTEDFERISWGIFWYCLHDIDLLLTTELRNLITPHALHKWITGDYYSILDESAEVISSLKPEWTPLKNFIKKRAHYTCPSVLESQTPLATVRQNHRGAPLSTCIRAVETLLLQETAPLLSLHSDWSSRSMKDWFIDHETFTNCKNMSRLRIDVGKKKKLEKSD